MIHVSIYVYQISENQVLCDIIKGSMLVRVRKMKFILSGLGEDGSSEMQVTNLCSGSMTHVSSLTWCVSALFIQIRIWVYSLSFRKLVCKQFLMYRKWNPDCRSNARSVRLYILLCCFLFSELVTEYFLLRGPSGRLGLIKWV